MKVLAILILLVAAPAGIVCQDSQPLLIRNVKRAPGRPTVDILIRRGLVEAIGPSGTLQRPFDAQVFDGKGLLLGPVFLDACVLANLAPKPTAPVAKTPPRDGAPTSPPLRSVDDDIDTRPAALDRLHPDRRRIDTQAWDAAGDEPRRRAGIAWALYAPATELCGGSGVLATTAAVPRRSRVLASDLGLFFALDRRRGRYPSTTMGAIAVHRQLFADAQRQQAWKAAHSRATSGVPRPPFEPGLARVEEVLDGRRPAFFVCRTEHEARRVLALFRGTKGRLVIAGPPRLARAGDAFAKAQAGVVLQAEFPEVTDPVLRRRLHRPQSPEKSSARPAPSADSKDPETKALEAWIRAERRIVREREKTTVQTFLNAPMRLSEAGVPFAFATTARGKADDLLSYARLAVEAGLSQPAARRALTGADKRLPFSRALDQGVRPGHTATFTLLDGPLWSWNTRIQAVVIDGRLEVLAEKPSGKGKTKGGRR